MLRTSYLVVQEDRIVQKAKALMEGASWVERCGGGSFPEQLTGGTPGQAIDINITNSAVVANVCAGIARLYHYFLPEPEQYYYLVN